MAQTTKHIIERTESLLDDFYSIATMDDPAVANMIHTYTGAIRACESLGYNWIRSENGKHTLIKIKS